ncbi:hypothetical protein T265_07109 [Opisthorchis viverrini]|uniref:Fork-head domain-containing protein n=2 Tax=Opisthorchis viverrini TaxID=6198 RepID=A0A074ZI13_OPIVI|nr:hypothetical protein T265_07109 [Opisthorchis viverrini]KER25427.1 hypothetical protein T265_07109 [Opisthorchis viverrini]
MTQGDCPSKADDTADMVEQTSDFLAKKLRQNWLTRYPDKTCTPCQDQDDSLTNLNWLQNINLTKLTAPDTPLSPPPTSMTHSQPSINTFSLCGNSTTHSRLSRNQLNTSSPTMHSNHRTKPQYINFFSTGSVCHRPSMLSQPTKHGSFRHGSHHRSPANAADRATCTFYSIPSKRNQMHMPVVLRTDAQSLWNNYSSTGTTGVTSLPCDILMSPPRPVIWQSMNSSCPVESSYYIHSSPGLSSPISQPRACPKSSPVLHCTPETNSAVVTNGSKNSITVPRFEMDTNEASTVAQHLPVIHNLLNVPVACDLLTKDGIAHSRLYPTLLCRNEGKNILSTSTNDTVDTSTSGLFHTLDSLDPITREKFREDPDSFPPYSFHSLIYMSMQSLKKQKVALTDIYSWIEDNFAYFRCSSQEWKEALRQNLVSSRCFQRVPRRKEEPGGRGDLWRLNPEFQEQLSSNRISSKFLHFWQHGVCCLGSYSNRAANKLNSNSVKPTRPVNTLEDIDVEMRSHEKDNLLDTRVIAPCQTAEHTTKRRRTEHFPKAKTTSSQRSSGISLSDTTWSSASGSSSPLSDLCTPPPQVPDTTYLSPDSLLSAATNNYGILDPKSEIDSLPLEDKIKHDFPITDVTTSDSTDHSSKQNYLGFSENISTDVADLLHNITSHGPTDQPVTIRDTEQSSHCDLQDISTTIDLNATNDPLDLTIRGLRVKSTTEWWNSSLSEFIHHFFTDNLGAECGEFEPDQPTTPSDGNDISRLCTPEANVDSSIRLTDCPEFKLDGDNSQTEPMISASILVENTALGQCNLPSSPFSLGEDQHWIDQQLNLEELDSILGLN